MSPITQKKLIYAFESIFLIRRIPVEGVSSPSFTLILEDQSESHYLSGGRLPRSSQLESLLYRCLRTEYFYRSGSQVSAFQFRNRSGSKVPIAFKSQNAQLGFIYSEDENPDRKTRGTASVFLRNYSNAQIIIFHEGSELKEVSPRVISCPITSLI